MSQSCRVSFGVVHCRLQELIEKGYLKAKNFINAQNKLAYSYIFTSSGINLKKEPTVAFLNRKLGEYQVLQQETKALQCPEFDLEL